jgi:colanic acid/amylovoran biosynthesis glycosyltransferase
MKILVFVENFMEPTLTFIYNEIVELSKYHEVKVLCTNRVNENKFPFEDVSVIPFEKDILREKILWHAEKYDIYISRKNYQFRKDATDLIKDFNPDIIHCHFGYESLRILDNINLSMQPIYISFHGYDASQMLTRKCYVNKLNSYFKYKNITPICCSNFIINNLKNAGVKVQNAQLLYYGIKTDFFTPTPRVKQDKFIFLQISSFREKKGHIYTLQAFKIFLNTIEDKHRYKLILAGGWGIIEEIKEKARLMGLADYVEFPGVVNHIEAKQLLQNANVFLHHSVMAVNNDTEGLPNAIIEAMAMELPVISTWHAGIPELVEDSVDGYLVKEKDVIAYAKRMHDVLQLDYLADSRKKVVSKFSNKIHCQSLLQIYGKQLINRTTLKDNKLVVAHLFSAYPGSNTTNWLYNLIYNTPACRVIIAAEKYTKHNFYSNEFRYIDNPLRGITQYKAQISNTFSIKLIDKIICYLTEKLLGGFTKYLSIELSKEPIDIAHAHFADVGCEYVDLIKQKKIPLIVSFYGYDYEYLPYIKPSYKVAYKKLFEKADVFICEGNHGANILFKMGCPKQKIKVIRLGVEIEKIPFAVKSKNRNTLNILQIASIREKKGHIYSLQAFHKALVNCPSMHLTFVGSGVKEICDQLKEYIAVNNLENNVTIIDEIDFNKLHQYILNFDVFIHPSCYSKDMDCEGGAPIVLLDAQACGLPIISTTHCDIPDEVVHGKTGLLTPEKDVEALTNSIKYFYEMGNEEYKIFSEAARNHVEKKYSIKKNAVYLKEVYTQLIK